MLFSSKELKDACVSRRRRELKAIWPYEAAALTEPSTQTAHGKTGQRLFGRRAAVAAACLLLLVSFLLIIGNSEVMAKAENWIKEVVGEWKIVRVKSTNPNASFVTYEMRWIPERFQHLIDEESKEYQYSAEYNSEHYFSGSQKQTAGWIVGENETLDSLAWGYVKTSAAKEPQMLVGVFDPDDQSWNITEEGEWEINGQTVLYYVYMIDSWKSEEQIHREAICCIWVDETSDLTFRLDGNLSREEAMKIVKNIRRVR